jgi:hypothetical protein
MSGTPRRSVQWDENNLSANEEYRKLHPVTMKIDEPKTPYVPGVDEEEDKEYPDECESSPGTWDPNVNALVRQVKATIPLVGLKPIEQEKVPDVAEAECGKKKKRPVLPSVDVNEKAIELREAAQKEVEFRTMRKAVYADEGAKFKALLGTTVDDDDDGDGNEKEL